MTREALILLLPAVMTGFIGGSGVLRLYIRHLVADGTLQAALWKAQSGFSSHLILMARILIAAAIPLLLIRIRLGGNSVGVLFREGERE